jgi:hypothetical protein
VRRPLRTGQPLPSTLTPPDCVINFRIRERALALGLGLVLTAGTAPAHPEHAVALLAAPLRAASPAAPASAAAPAVEAVARLSVTIHDAALGTPTAVRVRIVDENGRPLGLPGGANHPAADEARLAAPGSAPGLPAQAIAVMYGQNDQAQGFGFQPDGSFYVKGSFELPLPAGTFLLTLSKGYEFEREHDLLEVRPGDHLKRHYRLKRWVDQPARGWYSADDHIHLRRSPRENPLILDWIAAEDIHVGVLLQMGDFWTTYYAQHGFGRRGRYGEGNYLLLSGQEDPRTAELGHTLSLGAEQFVRLREDYYSFDRVFDRIRELGGVSGYAHQAMSFQGHRGLTLDALTGKIDFLELAQFCVPEGPLAVEHYYRLLDLGCKLTALAGSDFPWCGRGRRAGEDPVGPQIGDARFYTYTGQPLTYERWMAGVKAGRTFVTTGPMLEFDVNGEKPGSSLDVQPRATLRIRARAFGHEGEVPLKRLQLIVHGRVVAEVRPDESGQSSAELTLARELPVEHGLWLAVRADARSSQVAHTTPVYVTVNGDGFHNRGGQLDAQIEIARRHLQEIRELLVAANTPGSRPVGRGAPGLAAYANSRARLTSRIAEAERRLDALRTRR